MIESSVKAPNVRLLGRMDLEQEPVCLDWTGSGFMVNLKGTQLWAELEAPVQQPDMWVCATVEGYPIARFPVQQGRHWYPLVCGMSAETSRIVTLMKETQPMPASPEATVILHGIRYDGELLELPQPKLRIEFVGDSLTSAEGSLAPKDNDEWISIWFSACANYTHYAAQELGAERRVLSQSGYGVSWDWELKTEGNMADGYRQIAGVLKGEAAEKRGCQKAYDFTSWKADVVCVRLLTNDIGAMRRAERVEELLPVLTGKVADFIKTIRECNPQAKIVWILPSSDRLPQIGINAVNRCLAEGIRDVSFFVMPDYTEADYGARQHPNAAYNQRVGHMLADYLRSLVAKD
ncbi:MAG: hypothetical protein E7319_03175 [Clostridiales bacterium]|nr:hypothetical protein [Clostridiales bacterium]